MSYSLRLLIAWCAAPLVAGVFVVVALLMLRVSPWFLLLAPVWLALAVLTGRHLHDHFEEQGAGPLGFACGVVLVATFATGFVVAVGWAAPRHTCTVTDAEPRQRYNQGVSVHLTLTCDDGRTEESEPFFGSDPDEFLGERQVRAYDPGGWLPSLDLRHRVWWALGAGAAMVLAMTIHVRAVTVDEARVKRRLRRRPGPGTLQP